MLKIQIFEFLSFFPLSLSVSRQKQLRLVAFYDWYRKLVQGSVFHSTLSAVDFLGGEQLHAFTAYCCHLKAIPIRKKRERILQNYCPYLQNIMFSHFRSSSERIQIYSSWNLFVVFPFSLSLVSLLMKPNVGASHNVISKTHCHLQFHYLSFWNL